jgi:hypothetical protein
VRGLTEHDLLSLCEGNASAEPQRYAAALLSVAAPELAGGGVAELTPGQRDAALVELHLRTFGGGLEGFVRCPECDEALELDLGEERLRELLGARPLLGEHELRTRGYRLRFRAPTCGDLDAAATAESTAGARLVLLRRCVLEATRRGAPVDPDRLPDAVVSALAERLEECDPQAEISLALSCPECGHSWTAGVDVPAFLSAEVDAATRALLDDVHVLARGYGWTENEVLALGRRRRLYVELAPT